MDPVKVERLDMKRKTEDLVFDCSANPRMNFFPRHGQLSPIRGLEF